MSPSVIIRLAGALALALALTATAQDDGELQLRALLQSEGYTEIDNVAFVAEDKLWTATAEARDGTSVELRVHVPTGSILRAGVTTPALDQERIEEHLATLGYGDIHNARFDGALWRVEAESPSGQELVVLLDPNDGRVIDHLAD